MRAAQGSIEIAESIAASPLQPSVSQAAQDGLSSQLSTLQAERDRLLNQLGLVNAELERLRSLVGGMESSKFWKLRRRWMQLKHFLIRPRN
jgi:hypothetical protein